MFGQKKHDQTPFAASVCSEASESSDGNDIMEVSIGHQPTSADAVTLALPTTSNNGSALVPARQITPLR
jgi:hypothetical protein